MQADTQQLSPHSYGINAFNVSKGTVLVFQYIIFGAV